MENKLNNVIDSVKESKIGKFVRNHIGVPKGIGLPHQCGQNYEVNVPEAKHNTKAIEKGYQSYGNAFQQQQQQSQNVGNQRGLRR